MIGEELEAAGGVSGGKSPIFFHKPSGKLSRGIRYGAQCSAGFPTHGRMTPLEKFVNLLQQAVGQCEDPGVWIMKEQQSDKARLTAIRDERKRLIEQIWASEQTIERARKRLAELAEAEKDL